MRRPILIVDGFAGPGRFGDGSKGSPLIICEKAQEAIARGTDVSVICIESDADKLFPELEKNLEPYAFAEAKQGEFLDYVDFIEEKAKTHTVFLYVDPFTVEGLEWEPLDRIFQYVQQGKSIEVLMNFNTASFVRRGLAAMSQPLDTLSEEESEELVDAVSVDPPSLQRLDEVGGGSWWRKLLLQDISYAQKVEQVTEEIHKKLQQRFKEVCGYAVKEHWKNQVPKYYLVFASRHPDALILMNDAMTKAKKTFAEETAPEEETLFETRPLEVVSDITQIPDIICKLLNRAMKRKQLVLNVIRENFCEYSKSEITTSITKMIKSGRVVSETGKSRINDNVKIWLADCNEL